MKRIMKFWITAALCTIPCLANGSVESDQQLTQIEIVKTETSPSTGIDRSVKGSNISAYIIDGMNQVLVTLEGTGLTSVFILDSSGEIVDYAESNTDYASMVVLSANGPGNYYIVIIADTCYAEGAFTII